MTDRAAAAAVLPPSIAPDSVRLAFLRGIAWTGAARWFSQALTWASTLVVARLLAPEDYGIVAMAAVCTGFLAVVSEFGLGVTIVTVRDLTGVQIAQLHGLAILLGAAASGALAASAPLVARLYSRPELAGVVAAMAVTSLVAGARVVPSALLQKTLRFKRIAAIESGQAIAGAAVALAGATAGWHYWALIASVLTGGMVWIALTVRACPLAPAWPRSRTLGPVLTFTRHQLTGTVCWYGYANSDFAVAGRLLGPGPLGIYSMAWMLARIVPERLAAIAIRLTPALFSALQHDRDALRQAVYRVTEAIAVVTLPAVVGLALTADDVVRLAAGAKWAPAVLPLQLLSLYGAVDVLAQVLTRALVAAGDVRFTSRLGLVLLLALPPAFAFGASWGPAGIACAWLLVAPLVRGSIFFRACSRLGLDATAYGRALRPAVTATAAMIPAVLAAGLMARDWPALTRAAAEVAAGGGACAAALFAFDGKRVACWRREWRRLGVS